MATVRDRFGSLCRSGHVHDKSVATLNAGVTLQFAYDLKSVADNVRPKSPRIDLGDTGLECPYSEVLIIARHIRLRTSELKGH